jgi:hypothetical protein
MAARKKQSSKTPVSSKQRKIEKEVGRTTLARIEAEIAQAAPAATMQSAWIDHYLLIDFGFSGDYFYPNSIQFYSSTAFLCSKLIDNNSLTSLLPILACKNVNVTWDTATQKAVHIYGYQPKA